MAGNRSSKKRNGRKWLKYIIIFYVLWVAGKLLTDGGLQLSSYIKELIAGESGHSIPVSEEWNLIVVNKWNEIPEDYSVTLTELSNGQKIDSRIYPYIQEMFDAAREEGLYMIVREGYRTAEEQQKIYDDKIQLYMNEGYSHRRAEKTAKEWVAAPGTSEHQLGIAVDINADKSKSTNDEVYVWLAENAYRYGFILRYPQGKEDVTGTSYEPWHYRYVGNEAAWEIYERRICLEEYFE